MTRKELNLAIFEGTTDKVLWQPRLEMWMDQRRAAGTLPDRFKDLDRFGIYDALRCSPRYNVPSGLSTVDHPGMAWKREEIDHEHVAHIIETPWGELRTIEKLVWEDGEVVNHRIEEFAVSNVDDLKIVTKIIESQEFTIDPGAFLAGEEEQGDRAASSVICHSDGFTDLIKTYSGLPTNEFTPPPILERYCMPRWQKIGKLMKQHGRHVHSHWDGNSRHLLPYLKESGLTAVEALTVEPMGDMTLEGIKEATGDEIVVLDMIPVIYFLPNYPVQELMDFTKRVIDMFAPKLILGVSDELSAPGEIERVEMISDLLEDMFGPVD